MIVSVFASAIGVELCHEERLELKKPDTGSSAAELDKFGCTVQVFWHSVAFTTLPGQCQSRPAPSRDFRNPLGWVVKPLKLPWNWVDAEEIG